MCALSIEGTLAFLRQNNLKEDFVCLFFVFLGTLLTVLVKLSSGHISPLDQDMKGEKKLTFYNFSSQFHIE